MEKIKKVNSNYGSGIFGLFYVGGGICHGFFDQKGIPFSPAYIEQLLKWGPSVLGGAIGGLEGLLGGGLIGLIASTDDSQNTIWKALRSGALGAAVGTVGGAALGAGVAGLENLIGYGIGRFLGYMIK